MLGDRAAVFTSFVSFCFASSPGFGSHTTPTPPFFSGAEAGTQAFVLARQTLDYRGKSTAPVGYALKGNRIEGYLIFSLSLLADNDKNT